jgi:hypothetical protein
MSAHSISDCLQRNVRAFGPWAGALLVFFQLNGLLAQNAVSFEATVQAREIVVGVPFEVVFNLKNAEGSRFSPPDFPGFKQGSVSEMRGMSFVNGRSSSTQSWSLELIPSQPGSFSIGSATVVAGGQTLRSKPLKIKVISATARKNNQVKVPPGSDVQIFVAADFDQEEAYVGQQLTWRIRLYTQLSVEGYDILALPGFDGFFTKEKIRYDKRVEYVTLKGKKYAARTLHEEAVFPQEAGELTIGNARVSVGIEQPGAQGFLFGPKPVSLQTDPVSLTVKALPQPAPAEFTGGVGQYEWEVKADTNALTTDDALTLTVELKGNGDTRRFAAPKFEVPANCEIFEPRILEEEEYESETSILHRKRFEYVLLPKDSGVYEIRPILAYFDADSNQYRLLESEVIRFTVTPGANYQSPNALLEPGISEPLTPQNSGFWQQFGAALISPIFWGILAVFVALLLIFVLLRKRRPVQIASVTAPASVEMQADKPQFSSPPPTLPAVRDRFTQVGRLLNQGNPIQFYQELFKSLQAWLSARLGLQTAEMNDADVGKALLQRGASPIRVQALLSVWHTCEQAIYGGQAQESQMESTWRMAEQVLEALEREMK